MCLQGALQSVEELCGDASDFWRIKEAVGRGEVPVHRESDKGGMDARPGVEGEQQCAGFLAVVEGVDVVEKIGVENVDLWMVGVEPVTDAVQLLGVTAGHDDQSFAVEILRLEMIFGSERMIVRHGDTDAVLTEREIIGAGEHLLRIERADHKIHFCAEAVDD